MNNEEKYQNFDLQVMNWLESELDEAGKMALINLIQADKDLEQRFLAITAVDGLIKAEFAPENKKGKLLQRLELTLPSEAMKKQTQKFILDRISKIEERNEREETRKKKRKPATTSTFQKVKVPRRTQTFTKIQQIPQTRKRKSGPPIAFWISLAACAVIGFWGYSTYQHSAREHALPKPVLVEIGHLKKISGRVSIIRNQKEIAGTENMRIYVGDTFVSGDKSYADITLIDNTEIRVGLDSKVCFNDDNSSKQIIITYGIVSGKITKQHPGKPIIFTTTNSRATVLGTVLEISDRDQKTKLTVTEGKVKLVRLSDGASLIVPGGYTAQVQEGKKLQLEEILSTDDPRHNYRQPGN